MKRLFHLNWGFLSILGFLLSTTQSAIADVTIKLPEDSVGQFVGPSKARVEFKAGVASTVDLSEPLQITSATRIPIILVPIYSGHADINMDSPQTKDALVNADQKAVSTLLSTLMANIADVQNLIQKKRYSEATSQLDLLRTKYPDVKFLEFIRASILLLQGNRSEAQKTTEDALKFHPDYLEGKRFLEKLKGKNP
jgi:hypothetical protein